MSERHYNYASLELKDASGIVRIAEALSDGWIFRGQAKAKWGITSSLEREVKSLDYDMGVDFEAATLKHVKSSAPVDEARRLAPDDHFSWLALLQHHGCKTRLVDFTESFYVALYFAVRERRCGDSAVWAISTSKLDEKVLRIYSDGPECLPLEEIPKRLVNNAIDWSDRYVDHESLAVVYSKPAVLNQRLIAQQGTFVCPLNLSKSFMENLTVGLGLSGTKEDALNLETINDLERESEGGRVIKIRIPMNERSRILRHLRLMNLTEATLFPGLDGYCRSLNYFATEVA